MSTNLILDQSVCKKISSHLEKWLADNYLLLIKTQNFHWNLRDSRFYSLHQMFEEQYKNLFEGIDEIAERIRMLKIKSPGSMKEFLELSTLDESNGDLTGNQMIQELLKDHISIANYLRAEIEEVTTFGDQGTADLMIRRLQFHEKTAWMLDSTI